MRAARRCRDSLEARSGTAQEASGPCGSRALCSWDRGQGDPSDMAVISSARISPAVILPVFPSLDLSIRSRPPSPSAARPRRLARWGGRYHDRRAPPSDRVTAGRPGLDLGQGNGGRSVAGLGQGGGRPVREPSRTGWRPGSRRCAAAAGSRCGVGGGPVFTSSRWNVGKGRMNCAGEGGRRQSTGCMASVNWQRVRAAPRESDGGPHERVVAT